MPALFFRHGNPMNALAHNPFTDRWYNVVDESDLRNAARTLDQLGRVLDRVAEEAPEKRQSPAE